MKPTSIDGIGSMVGLNCLLFSRSHLMIRLHYFTGSLFLGRVQAQQRAALWSSHCAHPPPPPLPPLVATSASEPGAGPAVARLGLFACQAPLGP